MTRNFDTDRTFDGSIDDGLTPGWTQKDRDDCRRYRKARDKAMRDLVIFCAVIGLLLLGLTWAGILPLEETP